MCEEINALEECFCEDDLEINLIAACKKGDAVAARTFIDEGASVDARDRSNFINQFIGFTQSALQVAVNYGNVNVAEVLLRNGADVNLRDRFGFNALHLACKNGSVDCADVLLRYQADLSAVRQDGERAIHYAATSGNAELVKLLIDYGANPNEADVYGFNPLSYAASNGHIETCRTLCNHGATAKTKHVSIAYKHLHTEVVLYLFLHATEIDEEIAPRFHLAALYGEKFNLMPAFDLDIKDDLSRSLIHIGCKIGNISAVKFMLEHGSPRTVMQQDIYGLTPLHYACEPGSGNYREHAKSVMTQFRGSSDQQFETKPDFQKADLSVIDELVKHNCDVNFVPPKLGWTAVCHACYVGDYDCVEKLISYGCDLNAGHSRFPLHTAVSSQRSDIVKLLLDGGADPNIKGSNFDLRWTPLHLSVHHGDLKTTTILLEAGADANSSDGNLQQTPIHLVNGDHGPAIVKLLLKYGADVDWFKAHNETPLHSVCKNVVENADIVQELINGGANLNSLGWFDRTPLHYACERGHAKIIGVLIRAGARVDVCESSQDPKRCVLKGRFLSQPISGLNGPTMSPPRDALYTPLASLLQYYHWLRKITSKTVIEACWALTDVRSADEMIDFGESSWAKILAELFSRCPEVVLPVFESLCGTATPVVLSPYLLDFLKESERGQEILKWLLDECELTETLQTELLALFGHQGVRSLCSSCRIVIRKTIRIQSESMSQCIDSLPLPDRLKKYLNVRPQ